MHAFSAADLISPAIKRTKWFLFQPFRWSTFLKLCAVSLLTEGGGGGFSGNFNIPSGRHSGGSAVPHVPSIPTIHSPSFGLSPIEIALIAAVAMVFIGLSFVLFYLITRLRFSLFYCLVYQTREIRPGWRFYDAQSWRFFLLSVAVGFCFFFGMLLVAFPFMLGFYRLFRSAQPGASFDFAGFFSLLLPLIPIIIAVFLIGIAVHVILHDLMLPHIALENASAGEAWRQARMRIAAEKGGFLLFAFLRVLLPIVAGFAALIVLLIPCFALLIAFALPVAGLFGALTHATGLSQLLMLLLIALVALIGAAVAVVLGLCIGGSIGIATRNYALLFYGGRYKALGDLLDPPPAPAITNAPETV